VPALYLIANAYIAAAMLWGRPVECGVALAVAATGLPFYVRLGRRVFEPHRRPAISARQPNRERLTI